jgi:hypothetical protein
VRGATITSSIRSRQREYYSFYSYFIQSEETGEQRYINGGNVRAGDGRDERR